MLDLHDCIITTDAMGCQTEIAATIVEDGGDYVLALKGNQGTLCADVELLFDDLLDCPEAYTFETATSVDKDYGRIEVRRSWTISDPAILDALRTTARWPALQTLVRIQDERYLSDETTTEVRYFISSLQVSAEEFLHIVRTHRHIENRLHWVPDMTFREDDSRLRKDNGAQNFAISRRIAHNLLKQEGSCTDGIQNKHLRAGWDNDYLLRVLSTLFA